MMEIRSYKKLNDEFVKLGDISDKNLEALFKISLETVTNLYKFEKMSNKQIKEEVKKETGKFSLTYLKNLRTILSEKKEYLKNADEIKKRQRYIFNLTLDKYKKEPVK